MPTELSFDLSWETPEHQFGASDVNEFWIDAVVSKVFPGAISTGAGGGFHTRDMSWEVSAHLDQEALDELGGKIAKENPGRKFFLSQSAWDFNNLVDSLLEDLCGTSGEYTHSEPEGEVA